MVPLRITVIHLQQVVALTGRNTTCPPSRAAPGELRCICAAVECYRRRRQTPESKTILAPYTMRRRSNDIQWQMDHCEARAYVRV